MQQSKKSITLFPRQNQRKIRALAPCCLTLNPGSTIYYLCDMVELFIPQCFSSFPHKKGIIMVYIPQGYYCSGLISSTAPLQMAEVPPSVTCFLFAIHTFWFSHFYTFVQFVEISKRTFFSKKPLQIFSSFEPPREIFKIISF